MQNAKTGTTNVLFGRQVVDARHNQLTCLNIASLVVMHAKV